MREVQVILHQLFEPQAGALADGGELSGLQVRETERGQVRVFFAEVNQCFDHGHQAADQQIPAVAHQQQVRVVDHVHAGGAEVDDAAGRGGRVAESV